MHCAISLCDAAGRRMNAWIIMMKMMITLITVLHTSEMTYIVSGGALNSTH